MTMFTGAGKIPAEPGDTGYVSPESWPRPGCGRDFWKEFIE